jgi:cytochrome P450
MTLFLAGHETTANALTWALSLLALHPDVAAKLEREVDEVLGDRRPEYADLSRLPYAACVFKETMRLYPPAYQLGRAALTETRVGGYQVPRGRMLLLNVYAVHRRAEIFDEPEAFRPERFLNGAEKKWPRGAYIPFSVGPRVCVGNHFALMEGQLVLVRLAQRLRLGGSIPKLVATDPLDTLRPAERVRMHVRPRERRAHAS